MHSLRAETKDHTADHSFLQIKWHSHVTNAEITNRRKKQRDATQNLDGKSGQAKAGQRLTAV